MILQELFNTGETSYDLLINTQRIWVAQVKLKNKKLLEFEATKSSQGEWGIMFSVDGGYKVKNNSHNGAYVISTVLFLLKEFEQQKSPFFISFTADEDHGGIYQALIRRFSKQQGWIPFTNDIGEHATIFRLFKIPKNFFNGISVKHYGNTIVASKDDSNAEITTSLEIKTDGDVVELIHLRTPFVGSKAFVEILEKLPDTRKFFEPIEDYLIKNYEGYSFNIKTGLEKYFPKISAMAA